jgi:5,6,7,8-tetrahydromethanopterin hydro-lyase
MTNLIHVLLDPRDLDHQVLFDIHRKATAQAIHKAMAFEPTIDWLLENQEKVVHKYFEKSLKGEG